MVTKRGAVRASILILVGTIIAGANYSIFAESASNPTTNLRPIVIATGIDPTTISALGADRGGFFKKNGLRVTIAPQPSGAAAIQVMLSGNADAAIAADIPGISAAAKGAQIQLVAEVSEASGWSAITVSGAIKTAADLAGKKVAVTPATGAQYFLQRYLQDQHVPISSLSLISSQFPESFAAFVTGQVDAFAAGEPWPTKAQSAVKGAHLLTSSAPYATNFAYVYATPTLTSDAPLIDALVKSLKEGNDWLAQDPTRTAQLAANEYKIDPDLAKQLISKMKYRASFRQAGIEAEKQVAQWLVDNKIIPTAPDWSKFLAPASMKRLYPSDSDYSR